MMAQTADKQGAEYQRLTWDALRKSLNGLINKINVANIKNILPELFQENLVRGRGLLTRSLMKSQAASPNFTAVYAALVAVVNTKFPEIGLLLLKRLVLQFRRAYKRNDKPVASAAVQFIAHLTNQVGGLRSSHGRSGVGVWGSALAGGPSAGLRSMSVCQPAAVLRFPLHSRRKLTIAARPLCRALLTSWSRWRS